MFLAIATFALSAKPQKKQIAPRCFGRARRHRRSQKANLRAISAMQYRLQRSRREARLNSARFDCAFYRFGQRA